MASLHVSFQVLPDLFPQQHYYLIFGLKLQKIRTQSSLDSVLSLHGCGISTHDLDRRSAQVLSAGEADHDQDCCCFVFSHPWVITLHKR